MGTYLGQNFLIDSKVKLFIAKKIEELYKKLNCNAIVEIGPGKGAITKYINQISDNFFVIEKDEKMKKILIENGNIGNGKIIVGDVLDMGIKEMGKVKGERNKVKGTRGKATGERKKMEENELSVINSSSLFPCHSSLLIVGNLPYYITSPILRKFFADEKNNCAGGIFMIQKEVGEKIKSDANKKSFLRRLLNYGYEINILKVIKPKSFSPSPKVDSCLISIIKKKSKTDLDFANMMEFLEVYAKFSRKTLGKIQKIAEKQKLNKFTIPEILKSKRLEELSLNDLTSFLN
ncbi:MAG: rRNA adenine dimethyltransferase family protein [Candidatus Absconditabacterales bacterium]